MILQKKDDSYSLLGEIGLQIGKHPRDITKIPLSKKNCDELFGIFDVDKWIAEKVDNRFNETDGYHKCVYAEGIIEGFNKQIELIKDNKFNEEDMIKLSEFVKIIAQTEPHITPKELVTSFIKSTQQQQTEIEVEFLVEQSIEGKKEKFIKTEQGEYLLKVAIA